MAWFPCASDLEWEQRPSSSRAIECFRESDAVVYEKFCTAVRRLVMSNCAGNHLLEFVKDEEFDTLVLRAKHIYVG